MATTLRTVANVNHLTADTPAATVSVSGTPDQIAASAWLIEQLDKPARAPAAVLQNQTATFGDDLYVVYYLKNTLGPSALQEVITTLRTVENIQKIYNFSAIPAVAMRGTPAEVAMAIQKTAGIGSVYPCSGPPAVAIRASAAQVEMAGRLVDGWLNQ